MTIRQKKEKQNKISLSHVRSPYQEKSLAERLGGIVTPGSGNKFMKGDVRVRKIVRIETKCTLKKSFSLTLDMWHKIENAALSAGEDPAMEIEFVDELTGKPIASLLVTATYVLDDLVERNRDD